MTEAAVFLAMLTIFVVAGTIASVVLLEKLRGKTGPK